MRTKVSLFDRFKNKVRNWLYKILLKEYDFGSRVAKNTWEQQFAKGDWLYLKSEAEAGHYNAIVAMLKELAHAKRILDVGCGEAVLYDYLIKLGVKVDYLGIDLSATAITNAQKYYPLATFKQLDFDKSSLNECFDVIIFNESLYYFNRPLKRIKKAVKFNLNKNGLLIISMCESIGHDLIWKRLESNFELLKTTEIQNIKQQKWRVSVFKPMLTALLLIDLKLDLPIHEIADIFGLA